MPQDRILEDIISLRMLVGYLGEKHQKAWWNSSFLNFTGLQYLKLAFPRSHFSAAVNSVSEVARHLHDEWIGRSGTYHLFRLPGPAEEQIHRLLLNGDPEPRLRQIIDGDTAFDQLRKMAGNLISAPEGPVQIGTVARLFWQRSLEEMAKHYYDALSNNRLTFPYFSA